MLSRHARCVLCGLCCNGHSLLLNFYLSEIGRIKNPLCSASDCRTQNTSHLILHCFESDCLQRLLFWRLLSSPRPQVQTLGSIPSTGALFFHCTFVLMLLLSQFHDYHLLLFRLSVFLPSVTSGVRRGGSYAPIPFRNKNNVYFSNYLPKIILAPPPPSPPGSCETCLSATMIATNVQWAKFCALEGRSPKKRKKVIHLHFGKFFTIARIKNISCQHFLNPLHFEQYVYGLPFSQIKYLAPPLKKFLRTPLTVTTTLAKRDRLTDEHFEMQ